VQVANITNRELSITAQVVPWDQDSDGDIFFAPSSRHGRHLAQNIQISPENFLLKPGGKANIKIHTQLPRDASGEYFDAILFNREGTKQSELPALLLTQSVLSFVKAIKTDQLDGEYTLFEAKPQQNKNIMFAVTVKNKSNISVLPQGRISIFDAANERIGDPIPFGGNSFILPALERVFHITWDRILPPGRYRAEVTTEFTKTTKSLKKEFIFHIK